MVFTCFYMFLHVFTSGFCKMFDVFFGQLFLFVAKCLMFLLFFFVFSWFLGSWSWVLAIVFIRVFEWFLKHVVFLGLGCWLGSLAIFALHKTPENP